MQVRGIYIEGRDLVAAVLVVGVLAGNYYGTLPEEVVLTVLFAVLSAYGFSSRYHKSKRKQESGGGNN